MSEMMVQESSLLGSLIKLLLNAAALYTIAYLMSSVSFNKFKDALVVALILAIANVTIVPIIQFFTFPIRLLTFGLFNFIIDAALLYLIAYYLEGFRMKNFWTALIMAFGVALLNALLFSIYF